MSFSTRYGTRPFNISTDDIDDIRSGDGSDSTVRMQRNPPLFEAQSRVLNSDKFLNSIFSCFDIHPASAALKSYTIAKPWSTYLLKASLTCKKFYTPAMRVLWRSMDSWVPLIKLIPTVVDTGSSYLTATTKKAITGSSLERYFFYSDFVEQFHYHAVDRVSPHIFLLLHQYSSLGLLPSLKVLIISKFSSYEVPDGLYVLNLMIPPDGLSQITITDITSTTEIQATSFLQIAQTRSPELTGLTLHGDDSKLKGTMVLNTLKYFRNLERVDLGFFSDEGMEAVRTGPPFGVLKYLRLAGSVPSVSSMLDYLLRDARVIEKVIISLVPASSQKSQDTRQACSRLIRELTTNGANSNLKIVIIEAPSHNGEIQLHAAEQLLLYSGLPNCRRLKILSVPYYEVTIKDTATPCTVSLERLTLEGGATGVTSKSLSISKIFLIQRLFPNIKFLAISLSLKLDADQIKKMENRLSYREARCHKLEELTLLPFSAEAGFWKRNSGQGIFVFPPSCQPTESIADVVLLSRFLDHVFPHLKRINVEKIYDFVDHAWLDGLVTGVKQFRESVRKGNPKVCPRCRSSW